MKNLRNVLLACFVMTLAGCVSVSKVESGNRAAGERMSLTIDGAWNQISAPRINGPHAETWTMEGLPIDNLLVYSGLKNDEAIHAETGSEEKRSFKFRSNMTPDQIVGLFEGMLTRDASTFTLLKLEPAPFGGTRGFHFEYSLIRKRDNVQLLGMGSGAISKGELFAVVYQAPRLVFYQRHHDRVAQIIASARIQGENGPVVQFVPQAAPPPAPVAAPAKAPVAPTPAPVPPPAAVVAVAPAPKPAPVVTPVVAPPPAPVAAPAVAPIPATASSVPPQVVPVALKVSADNTPRPIAPAPTAPAAAEVPFEIGQSSADVEQLGKEQACASTRGAGLTSSSGPVETYRLACTDGRVLLARCEFRQCALVQQ